MHRRRPSRRSGVTIVEVLITAMLIFVALGAILGMNTRALHLLRATRQTLAASQIVQQRVEALRDRSWPEIARAQAAADFLRRPTSSEAELASDAFVEYLSVSVPGALGGESAEPRAFHLRRENGRVEILEDADLTAEPVLLVNSTLQWRDRGRPQQRVLRAVLSRSGLTRGGIFGSNIGRPTPPPATEGLLR